MIHQKISQTAEERLANLAIGAMKMARSQATSPNGSASFTNADGTRTVLGAQNTTGTTMATHVGDTAPPGRPLGIAGASSAGVVYVAWGGNLDGGIPADFDHVTCYMTVSGVDQLVGTLTKAGIVSTIPMQTTATVEVWATAEDDACLADGTAAHNISGTSDRATVTVTQAADSASVQKLQDGITQAVNDAATAKTNASTAVDTANGAKSTADAAKSTAEDAWSRTLRVQVSSIPADATGDTSALTATVWRGGELLTEQEVAMMGLVAWYVGGSRVATGYTYSCAAGTAVECRLEA